MAPALGRSCCGRSRRDWSAVLSPHEEEPPTRGEVRTARRAPVARQGAQRPECRPPAHARKKQKENGGGLVRT